MVTLKCGCSTTTPSTLSAYSTPSSTCTPTTPTPTTAPTSGRSLSTSGQTTSSWHPRSVYRDSPNLSHIREDFVNFWSDYFFAAPQVSIGTHSTSLTSGRSLSTSGPTTSSWHLRSVYRDSPHPTSQSTDLSLCLSPDLSFPQPLQSTLLLSHSPSLSPPPESTNLLITNLLITNLLIAQPPNHQPPNHQPPNCPTSLLHHLSLKQAWFRCLLSLFVSFVMKSAELG